MSSEFEAESWVTRPSELHARVLAGSGRLRSRANANRTSASTARTAGCASTGRLFPISHLKRVFSCSAVAICREE